MELMKSPRKIRTIGSHELSRSPRSSENELNFSSEDKDSLISVISSTYESKPSTSDSNEDNTCSDESSLSSDYRLSEITLPKEFRMKITRGRPKKQTQTFYFNQRPNEIPENNTFSERRKRGRPKKNLPSLNSNVVPTKIIAPVPKIPKKRGRPPKYGFPIRIEKSVTNNNLMQLNTASDLTKVLADVKNISSIILSTRKAKETETSSEPLKKKRGRPRKIPSPSEEPIKHEIQPEKSFETIRKRGRPLGSKNSECRITKKIDRNQEGSFFDIRYGNRRSARVISPEYNSPSVLKQRKTINLPMEIPSEQHIPDFDRDDALMDLLALYNTVPDNKVALFHMQLKSFIITLKEVVPCFTRDSSPRL